MSSFPSVSFYSKYRIYTRLEADKLFVASWRVYSSGLIPIRSGRARTRALKPRKEKWRSALHFPPRHDHRQDDEERREIVSKALSDSVNHTWEKRAEELVNFIRGIK